MCYILTGVLTCTAALLKTTSVSHLVWECCFNFFFVIYLNAEYSYNNTDILFSFFNGRNCFIIIVVLCSNEMQLIIKQSHSNEHLNI